MRVFYGMGKGNAHRYQCRGDGAHVGAGLCICIGGVRIDRAVALQILEAVSNRAVEAAIFASDQVERSRKDMIAAVERELELARYEASLASQRYELVDPQKRHVARELEARWNTALERVTELERRIEELSTMSAARPSNPSRTSPPACPRSACGMECGLDRYAGKAKSRPHRGSGRSFAAPRCEADPNEVVLLIHWTGDVILEVASFPA